MGAERVDQGAEVAFGGEDFGARREEAAISADWTATELPTATRSAGTPTSRAKAAREASAAAK